MRFLSMGVAICAALLGAPVVHAVDCTKFMARPCVVDAYEVGILSEARATDVFAWVSAVEMKAAIGDYAGATSLMRRDFAPQNSPFTGYARVIGTAIYAIEIGQDDAAISHAKKLSDDAAFAWYLQRLGRHFARSGDIDGAKDVAEQSRALNAPAQFDLDLEIMMAVFRKQGRAQGLVMADTLLQRLTPPKGRFPPRDLRNLAFALAKCDQPQMARDVYALIDLKKLSPGAFPGEPLEALIAATSGDTARALDITNGIDDPALYAETLIEIGDYMAGKGMNTEVIGRIYKRAIGRLQASTDLTLRDRAALFEQMFWSLPPGVEIRLKAPAAK